MKLHWALALLAFGALLIGAGAVWIFPPAGLIVAGVAVICLVLYGADV